MSALRLTFDGVAELPETTLREALRCKDRLEQQRVGLGLASLNKSFLLQDGAQVYVAANETITRVHVTRVVTPTSVTTTVTITTLESKLLPVADFVSGVVRSPAISSDKITNLTQTYTSATRFTDDRAKAKLAVLPDVRHQPIEPPVTPIAEHSYVTAGMFSGYMRALVQLVLGIGIVGPETLEARKVKADELDYITTNEDVQSGFGLPIKEDNPGVEIPVKFDYRFGTTHGLVWGPADPWGPMDDTRRCYLVEIGQAGVFAKRLELDPVSLTEDGYGRYVELFPELLQIDSHGMSLRNALGGFPVDNYIPTSTVEKANWVRAGELIELISAEGMEAFYEGGFLSTAMGWVFQPDGNRADNTCIKVVDGCKVGCHYAVTFALAKEALEFDEPKPSYKEWLKPEEEVYLKRKAARLTEAQYQQVMAVVVPASASETYTARVDFLKTLEVTGPLRGTATLRHIKEGVLYHPGIAVPQDCSAFSGQPQIKFYEPLLGGLVSFNFTPAPNAVIPERCDAPIAVLSNNGGGIAVVNYFWEPDSPLKADSWDTREPCQYTGSWKQGSSSSGDKLHGNFYTSHADFRQVVKADDYIQRTTTGTLNGYSYSFGFCAIFAMYSKMQTNVWHSFEWEETQYGSRKYNSSIAFPRGERNVYYALDYTITTDKKDGAGFIAPSVSGRGPFTRYGVIYHFIWHWVGICKIPPFWDPGPRISCRMKEYRDPEQNETCFPDAPLPPWYNYELVPVYYHLGDNCTNTSALDNPEYFKTYPGNSWTSYTDPETVISWKVRMFGDIEFSGGVSMEGELGGFIPDGDALRSINFYDTPLSPWWFKPSPDFCEQFASLYLGQSWWGNRLVNFDEQVSGSELRHYGAPEYLQASQLATYVGFVQ